MRTRYRFAAFLLTVYLESLACSCSCDGPPLHAEERVLRNDLKTLRDVLAQYRGDRGEAPRTLDDLVQQGYLRKVPIDPITRSGDSWALTLQDTPSGPRIVGIHSRAPGTARDGTRYSAW